MEYVQIMYLDFKPIMGGLQVYALFTQAEYTDKLPYTDKIYWSDDIAKVPQGPFKGVKEAIDSYKIIVNTRLFLHKPTQMPIPPKALEVLPESNILDLDAFRASRPRRSW